MRDLIPFDQLSRSLAPFTDPNFKLAVLSELIEARVLDFGDFQQFLQFIEGQDYDDKVGAMPPRPAPMIIWAVTRSNSAISTP
ncbi:hypothetical protein [Sulfitobacter aestuariivivens]|uniref:hypothetical protein n=1 Tax=Sulfitobacter aestuariivivens TaxID=2766981 RepID=UPI003606E890